MVRAVLPGTAAFFGIDLAEKPRSAASGGVGAAAPTCESKIPKAGYTGGTIRESASARRLVER
jgi:hypothetical protein